MGYKDKIVGHTEIIEFLKKIKKNKSIYHFYIFEGPNLVGKKTTAYEFAKSCNCEDNDEEACNQCKSCILAEKGIHPDIIQIVPEKGKKFVSINQIREVQNIIYFPPIVGNYKIFIFAEADRFSVEVQNALLKTLEEPPKSNIFVLIVSNRYNLLTTILSRAQIITFNPVSREECEKYIEKKYPNLDIKKKEEILTLSNGLIGKIESLLNEDTSYLDTLFKIKEYDYDLIFKLIDEFSNEQNISKFLNSLIKLVKIFALKYNNESFFKFWFDIETKKSHFEKLNLNKRLLVTLLIIRLKELLMEVSNGN